MSQEQNEQNGENRPILSVMAQNLSSATDLDIVHGEVKNITTTIDVMKQKRDAINEEIVKLEAIERIMNTFIADNTPKPSK